MQYLKNELEQEQIQNIPYALAFESLKYAQTCTTLDISFVVEVLSEYQSHLKKILKYLQGIKDHILTYRRFDHLKVIKYSNLNFPGCVNTKKSPFGYLFLLAGWMISWKSAK